MSIQRFTDALRKAADGENYYAALALALTLPDVCGKIATPETKNPKRYVDWIEKYLPADYWNLGAQGFEAAFKMLNYQPPRITPTDFYALRCAYLHEGKEDITDLEIENAVKQFKFVVRPKGMFVHRNVQRQPGRTELLLDVVEFCREIYVGVEAWSRDIANDAAAQARLLSLLQIYFINLRGSDRSG